MAGKTFVEIVSGAKILIASLKGRISNLPAGVTSEQVSDAEAVSKRVDVLNQEQEKLKADLKVKTAELDAAVKELEEKSANLKKYTKLGTKQEEWREFGIEDKR